MAKQIINYEQFVNAMRFQAALDEFFYCLSSNYVSSREIEEYGIRNYILALEDIARDDTFIRSLETANQFYKEFAWLDYFTDRYGFPTDSEVVFDLDTIYLTYEKQGPINSEDPLSEELAELVEHGYGKLKALLTAYKAAPRPTFDFNAGVVDVMKSEFNYK